LSRYHIGEQRDGRGWMLLRLDALHTGFPAKATVIECDLPESRARERLTEVREAEAAIIANGTVTA
jgi:hypothetical protein